MGPPLRSGGRRSGSTGDRCKTEPSPAGRDGARPLQGAAAGCGHPALRKMGGRHAGSSCPTGQCRRGAAKRLRAVSFAEKGGLGRGGFSRNSPLFPLHFPLRLLIMAFTEIRVRNGGPIPWQSSWSFTACSRRWPRPATSPWPRRIFTSPSPPSASPSSSWRPPCRPGSSPGAHGA